MHRIDLAEFRDLRLAFSAMSVFLFDILEMADGVFGQVVQVFGHFFDVLVKFFEEFIRFFAVEPCDF